MQFQSQRSRMVPRIHEPRVLSSAQPIFGLFVIVIWTFILLPAQVFLLVLRLRVSDKICRLYFSGVCRIIGVNVHVFGNPKINRPILYLSNHSSWLDIPILGRLFRSTATSIDKKNLMIFLRPTILRDALTTKDLSEEKFNLIRAKQILNEEFKNSQSE